MANQSTQSQADNEQQAKGGGQSRPATARDIETAPAQPHSTGDRNSPNAPQEDARDKR